MAEPSYTIGRLRRDILSRWGEDSEQVDAFDHLAKLAGAVPDLRDELKLLIDEWKSGPKVDPTSSIVLLAIGRQMRGDMLAHVHTLVDPSLKAYWQIPDANHCRMLAQSAVTALRSRPVTEVMEALGLTSRTWHFAMDFDPHETCNDRCRLVWEDSHAAS